jgi:large subunit ribosomal protein L9
MRVYLLKDVPQVGIAGEMLNVADGYAQNYLIPRKLAVLITPENQQFFEQKKKTVEKRQEVIATETSMLAERIKSLNIVLRRKMHDTDKLYGSVAPGEIVDLLADKGVKISKSQVLFDKSIKQKGTFEVTIKLSSRLQPKVKLSVVPEEIKSV